MPADATMEYRVGATPELNDPIPHGINGCNKEGCYMEAIPDTCDVVADQLYSVTARAPPITWKAMTLQSYTCAHHRPSLLNPPTSARSRRDLGDLRDRQPRWKALHSRAPDPRALLAQASPMRQLLEARRTPDVRSECVESAPEHEVRPTVRRAGRRPRHRATLVEWMRAQFPGRAEIAPRSRRDRAEVVPRSSRGCAHLTTRARVAESTSAVNMGVKYITLTVTVDATKDPGR